MVTELGYLAMFEKVDNDGCVSFGAHQKSLPRGASMQHLAPRQNPELSNGHLMALD